jgi:hypothetical protein
MTPMARNIIKVSIDLDRLHCYDEGDGWGNAEPYLWTVFFKVDGETVRLTESLTLSGSPTIVSTPGSHGNLGDTDVDEGDDVSIPSNVGEWETILSPIPAPASISSLLADVGGVVGVVAILMEEDNVSDDGAEAGHEALNAAVRDSLQQIIDTRSLTNQDVSEKEIEGFTAAIEGKIKDAIVNQQNFFENFWSWINPDDTIGVKVFIFRHDDLDPATTLELSQRWQSEGDWELSGSITSTPLCPARALSGLFSDEGNRSAQARITGEPASERRAAAHPRPPAPEKPLMAPLDMEAMRKFRDDTYRNMPGLSCWFALAERHAGRVVRLALGDPELLRAARAMVEWGTSIAREPDAFLAKEHVEHAERLLSALSTHRNRHARVDARRALSVLSALHGKTHREALRFLAEIGPGRYPRVAGNAGARILPRPGKRDRTRTPEPEG